MVSRSAAASVLTLLSGFMLWMPAAFAQGKPAWVDPPTMETPAPEDVAPPHSGQPLSAADPMSREQVARDLAYRYLNLWSAPNDVALSSAASFYGPVVLFHGRRRTLSSVLAEKHRFAERWPVRTYRYRPQTTQVACEASGERCTVWSMFDFSAASPRHHRRSRGIGEHELIVGFSPERPVIVSETSRVIRRGSAGRALVKRGEDV
jgi:hypothetical protein